MEFTFGNFIEDKFWKKKNGALGSWDQRSCYLKFEPPHGNVKWQITVLSDIPVREVAGIRVNLRPKFRVPWHVQSNWGAFWAGGRSLSRRS